MEQPKASCKKCRKQLTWQEVRSNKVYDDGPIEPSYLCEEHMLEWIDIISPFYETMESYKAYWENWNKQWSEFIGKCNADYTKE